MLTKKQFVVNIIRNFGSLFPLLSKKQKIDPPIFYTKHSKLFLAYSNSQQLKKIRDFLKVSPLYTNKEKFDAQTFLCYSTFED